jgi:predicted small integral membrane protein
MESLDDAFSAQIESCELEIEGLKLALLFYMVYDMVPATEYVKLWRTSEIDGKPTPYYDSVPVVPEQLELLARVEKITWCSTSKISPEWFSKWTHKGHSGSIPKFYTDAALKYLESIHESP